MSTDQQYGSIPAGAVEAAPGLWRTSVQQFDLSVPGREMVQVRVDITPDSPPIRHFHHGEEIIYVVEGSLEYGVGGQEAGVCPAGDGLTVPAGVIQAVPNVSTGIATQPGT